MAFIEFSETAGQSLNGARPQAVIAAAQPVPTIELTALEWRVIELARDDGLVTLQPQRKRSWLERFIFGPTPPSPMLADEKLEALRKLAVQAWHHGYTLPSSAMKNAVVAGYNEWQIGYVIDAIVARRPAFRRING